MTGLFALMALGTAVCGAVPFFLAGKKVTGTVLLIALFIISYFTWWAWMPSFAYPIFGAYGAINIILLFVTSLIARFADDYNEPKAPGVTVGFSGVGLAIICIWLIASMPACNTGRYSALIGEIDEEGVDMKHWTEQTEELDPTHIRTVPLEHAISIAKTTLNQHSHGDYIVGSQYQTADKYATLQKINGNLYYAIPLDYRRFGVWRTKHSIPGYVIVNAEDRSDEPKYIDGHTMKFTPQAFWSEDLKRHLYQKYLGKVMMDFSFEVDDDWNPWWVITICSQSIGYGGRVIEGIVIVDPKTGKDTYYEKDSKDIPDWVDRVIPVEIIQDYLGWWGKYKYGYWNNAGWNANMNLREPEATTFNYGKGEEMWFVTPMTSVSEDDQTMTDLIYTNSRTGKSHRVTVSGATEAAMKQSVDDRVKFQHLHSSDVVYENVQGRLTAITPVLAEDHSIAGIAFVDVVGKNIQWGTQPLSVMRDYMQMIAKGGSEISTDVAFEVQEFTGTLMRFQMLNGTSGSEAYMYFNELPEHVFSVSTAFTEVFVTEPGDRIWIKYRDTKSDLISVMQFDNKTIEVKRSKNQSTIVDDMEERQEEKVETSQKEGVKNAIRNNEIDEAILDSLSRDYILKKKKEQ